MDDDVRAELDAIWAAIAKLSGHTDPKDHPDHPEHTTTEEKPA